MENKLEQLKKRAEYIFRNSSIDTFTGEKELIETLNAIGKLEKYDELSNTTLDIIERYLKAKEKMILKEEDAAFIKELSEDLKHQNIRRTDGIIYIPLFKLLTVDGKEEYFLTRKRAEKHVEDNPNKYASDIIEIKENNNTDIARIIEILIRNY